MSLLEFMYEREYLTKWEDEDPHIQLLIIQGWNLAMQAIKKQTELLEVEDEIR